MKATIQRFVAVMTLLAASPVVALAAAVPANPAGPGETLTVSKIVTVITEVINAFIALAVTVVIAMIIYGGFKMAISRGDPGKFKEGRTILTNAIIGLVVVLGVGIIVRTIGDFAVSPTSIGR